MTKAINITEDEFDAAYPLRPNHLNPHASWVVGDGPGCLFETYGEELDFVRSQDSRTVWTFLEGDDAACRAVAQGRSGSIRLLPGFFAAGRGTGHIVVSNPLPDNLTTKSG